MFKAGRYIVGTCFNFSLKSMFSLVSLNKILLWFSYAAFSVLVTDCTVCSLSAVVCLLEPAGPCEGIILNIFASVRERVTPPFTCPCMKSRSHLSITLYLSCYMNGLVFLAGVRLWLWRPAEEKMKEHKSCLWYNAFIKPGMQFAGSLYGCKTCWSIIATNIATGLAQANWKRWDESVLLYCWHALSAGLGNAFVISVLSVCPLIPG